ncbi:MAG: exonuclease SbcCD subunit D C-terminal domain-containing protein [Desulfuromonadales bacterium]
MRIFHSADWHLGHSLLGVSREYEHRLFLAWLLETLETAAADALILAGDIFDTANPPASAQALFYRFLVEAKQRCPQLDVVAVAGNHDSPARLEAPAPLLAAMGVRVVGVLPRRDDGRIDARDLLFPLRDRRGETAALCAAVPFLRPADVPVVAGDASPVDGYRRVYSEIAAAAGRNNLPLLATGHCYLAGTHLSELSERKIFGGNQHALPLETFPDEIAYAALGHLHLPQAVGGRAHIRFSGSPIPLSLSEDRYPHQVVQIDLDASGISAIAPLAVPRSVPILRLPGGAPQPLAALVAALRKLDPPDDLPAERHPFLEVSVLLEKPEPALRQQIEEALAGKAVRLLKIVSHYPGARDALADVLPELHLCEMPPEEVFLRRYAQKHAGEPSPALLAAFHTLLEQAEAGEEG